MQSDQNLPKRKCQQQTQEQNYFNKQELMVNNFHSIQVEDSQHGNGGKLQLTQLSYVSADKHDSFNMNYQQY